MPQTNAERQRRYRNRQKEKDLDGYLKTEAKRKRDSYVPSNKLSKEELEDRRKDQRKKSKLHYEKTKKRKQ